MDGKKIFPELCTRFCMTLNGPIFGVKLNLHISKTVKDIWTSSLTDIATANVCVKKKTRGLYHVCERRYLNFSPVPFSVCCGYTYRAGCIYISIFISISMYIYTVYIYMTISVYICCRFKGKRKPSWFSLIHLLFAHHANRSLSFVPLFMKKQMDVIWLLTD